MYVSARILPTSYRSCPWRRCVRFFSKVHAGESSRERTCLTTVCHRPASKMQCQIFRTLLRDIYITGLFNVIHVLRPLFVASMWTNVPTVVERTRRQSRLEPIGDRDNAATLVIWKILYSRINFVIIITDFCVLGKLFILYVSMCENFNAIKHNGSIKLKIIYMYIIIISHIFSIQCKMKIL